MVKAPSAFDGELPMRIGWRWLLLVGLGVAAARWALKRTRRPLQEDEARVYGDELERMQDA
jgi:hypothetical protein